MRSSLKSILIAFLVASSSDAFAFKQSNEMGTTVFWDEQQNAHIVRENPETGAHIIPRQKTIEIEENNDTPAFAIILDQDKREMDSGPVFLPKDFGEWKKTIRDAFPGIRPCDNQTPESTKPCAAFVELMPTGKTPDVLKPFLNENGMTMAQLPWTKLDKN